MFNALKEIKDNDRVGDFLFPSMPEKVKGKVSHLSQDMVVIDSELDGEVYQYVTHPNNIVVVQKKAAG